MSAYYDLEQIRRLGDVIGTEAGAIVASMLTSMTEAIEQAESALAAGDFDRAGRAAHRCRNDALMLGARELLNALRDLESAARDCDEARCGIAFDRLRAVWAPTRDELAAASGR